MKIVSLSIEEFDSFAKKHKLRSFYQSSSYGNIMKKYGFKPLYIGIKNHQGELIGASLILSKDLFSKYKYAYAPRGFLIDYTDPDLLIKFTDELKKKFFKEGYIYIKIDPMIHCSERKSDGTVLTYNPEIDNILSILKKAGYIHHGFTNYFENVKPRYHAVTKLTKNNTKLFDQFSKRVRNKIRKAEYHGVEVYKGTKEDLSSFYELTKKHKKPLSYYQSLINEFNDQVEFYFAKINTEKYVFNIKTKYEQELDINEYLNQIIQNKHTKNTKVLNKKMESDRIVNNLKLELVEATKLLTEYPNGLVIASICTLKYDKSIYLLKEGFQKKYGKFNPLYLIKWHIIKESNKEGLHTFNQNIITGNFSKENKYHGLNQAKLEFNATAIEYIGEFDYIINPTIYHIYNLKSIRKKINKKAE